MTKAVEVKVAPNGRMVLPSALRKHLGLREGGTVLLSVEDGTVRLEPMAQQLAHAQDLYRRYAAADASSDAFLAERRRESAKD